MVKKILVLSILFTLMTSCGSSKRRVVSHKKRNIYTTTTKSYNTPSLADKIIWTAVSYKGTPYKYGGTTKRGMDCSGLIMISFLKRGVSLPRTSYNMSKKGYLIPLRQAKRGDLLFFKTNPRKPNRISHVGLVTSVKNGVVYFIHASTRRGVVVNSMSERYYKRAFVKAKRVL